MDNYINKVVEKMQEDCESFANIEWVKSILTEMSQLSYEAGQQSQQAKVSELEEQTAYKTISLVGTAIEENVELKKRMNAALKLINEKSFIAMHNGCHHDVVIKEQIEQALKGECKHESDGSHLLSNPPKTKCKKCGEVYSVNKLKVEG